MHRTIPVLVVCAGLVATARAQNPIGPPPARPPVAPSKISETKRPLTVQGCIWDTRLQFEESLSINQPASVLFDGKGEFILEGPKELMRQLKADHNGHEELISGIVTIPANSRDTLTSTKRVGPKTTITATGKQSEDRADRPDPDKNRKYLRLKVEEVRHIQNKCPYPF